MEDNVNIAGYPEDILICITKFTADNFLKEENPGDLIALYFFYCYTSKWQKTNCPKCTTEYVSNGLHWTIARVRKAKKKLIELGLIEDVVKKDANQKVVGHYIQMKYAISKEYISAHSQTGKSPQGGNEIRVAESDHKYLKNNNIKYLKNNKENTNKQPSEKSKKKQQELTEW